MANPSQIGGSTVSSSLSSRSYAVTAATSPGDTLLVVISVNNTSCTVSALTDSQGNQYTLDKSFTTASPMLYGFRSPGATGGSGGGPTAGLAVTDTWTLTTAAVSGNVELIAADAPGVGAVDQISTVTTGTSTTPSVSATPAAANETCIAGFVTAGSGGSPTINSPFTSVGIWQSGTNPYNTMAYDVLTGGSGTAQTSTLTIVSAAWRGVMWTFQAGSFSGSAALSGSGSLAAAGTRPAAAALSGSGALTASPTVQATLTNSFEGGSSGTVISVANSGGLSGSPWDSLGGSATLPAYSSAGAIIGTLAGGTPLAGNSTTTLEWRDSFALGFNASSVPWYVRDYFSIASLPPVLMRLSKFQDDLASVDVWGICMDTTGKLGIRDLGAGAWQGQAATAVTAGTRNRYECQVSYNGSAYSVTLRCFYGSNFSGTTPDETVSGTITSSSPVNVAAFGAQAATAQTWAGIYHDSIGLTGAGWFGPDTSQFGSIVLSGSGTLSLPSRFAGAAALAGTGLLSATSRFSAAAALAGAGTLADSPVFTPAAVLSGSGTLHTAEIAGVIAILSGSGVLSAGAVYPGSMPLAGQGTLSAAETIGWAAALSGTGTLSAMVSGFNFAVLAGSGSLAVSSARFVAGAVLAGSGSLVLAPAFRSGTVLAGLGSFSAAPAFAPAVPLAGLGSFSAAPVLAAAAALAGTGSLGGMPLILAAVNLSGQGTLGGAGVRVFNALALISGSGTLAVGTSITANGGAALSGEGLFSAAGLIIAPPLSLSGSGTLAANAALTLSEMIVLLGSGSLSSAPIIPVPGSAVLSGTGVLTASWIISPPTADWLWADYQKKLNIALRLWQFWREAKSTGDPIQAAPAFFKAYQADAQADAAYALWLHVSGFGLPVQ
jgi:hypothetical protein